MNDQGSPLERRRLLRWLGAATLVLPAALAACANSNTSGQRTRSDIRGSDHRDAPSDNVYLFGRTYRF